MASVKRNNLKLFIPELGPCLNFPITLRQTFFFNDSKIVIK